MMATANPAKGPIGTGYPKVCAACAWEGVDTVEDVAGCICCLWAHSAYIYKREKRPETVNVRNER